MVLREDGDQYEEKEVVGNRRGRERHAARKEAEEETGKEKEESWC